MSTSLSQEELDIRYVFLGDGDESALTAILPHLDDHERTRAKHFLLMEDRLAFATGRALVRSMLSAHAICPAEGWHFSPGSNGKPAIGQISTVPDLRFNISHCRGIVVAAMSLGREVGVDVEFTDLQVDHLEFARAYFAVEEAKQIEALSGELRRDAFFAYWTLKEAYLKATGEGLSLPLSEYAFTLKPLQIVPRETDLKAPKGWFLWQCHLTPSHLLSVVAEPPDKQESTCYTTGMKLSDFLNRLAEEHRTASIRDIDGELSELDAEKHPQRSCRLAPISTLKLPKSSDHLLDEN